jgi:hypothetical protein
MLAAQIAFDRAEADAGAIWGNQISCYWDKSISDWRANEANHHLGRSSSHCGAGDPSGLATRSAAATDDPGRLSECRDSSIEPSAFPTMGAAERMRRFWRAVLNRRCHRRTPNDRYSFPWIPFCRDQWRS